MTAKSTICFLFLVINLMIICSHAHAVNNNPVWQLVDKSGVPQAWLLEDGTLHVTGSITYCTPLVVTSSDDFYVTNGASVIFVIKVDGPDGGNLKFAGPVNPGNPAPVPSANHQFYIVNPNNPSDVLMSVDDNGILHLKDPVNGLEQHATTARASYLAPWNITARSISPVYPTPNSWADLPEAYKGDNLTDLSPLNILSMFIFYPNLNWDEDMDGMTNKTYLRNYMVNDVGCDWGPITFSSNGSMYITGVDSVGLEKGVALFNRKMSLGGVYNRAVERIVFNRLKNLIPGNYDGTRSVMSEGGTRGKILAWYHPDHQINLHSDTTDNVTELNKGIGCNLFSTGLIYLNGNLYNSFFESLKDDGKISIQHTLYKHHAAGMLCIRNIDNWKSDHGQPYASYSDVTGREWETEYPGVGNDKSYIRLMTKDGHYLPIDSSAAGAVGNLIMSNPANNFIWSNGKFIYPTFIQFGKGYLDYREPSSDALGDNERYVYAISNHGYYNSQDALYLGRCKLNLGAPGTGTDQWGTWQYFSGVNVNGNPLWESNVDHAKSILYCPSGMGHPLMIYEKNTDLYIMSAIECNNSQQVSSPTWHYGLYVARKPWGPWRKVFTNDYNGMINRAAQDMRNQGGSPENVYILPPNQEDFTLDPVTGVRKLKLWLEFGQFEFCSHYMLFGRTGIQIAKINGSANLIAPWDEYFKQTYYLPCFQQVELTVPPDIPTLIKHELPATVETTFPDYRPEGKYHYDHWGWRVAFQNDNSLPTTVTFSLDPIWVGHRFKVGPRNINVSQLGRFYQSGSTLDHEMAIVTSNSQNIVARAKVSNGGKMFEPATNVARDGYIYAPLTYTPNGGTSITLSANQEYCLLSREGIGQEAESDYQAALGNGQALKYSAIEYAKAGELRPCTSGTQAIDPVYVGYRFRTGPLGLRVVGVLGSHISHIGVNRKVIIAEANTQTVIDNDAIFKTTDTLADIATTVSLYNIASSTTPLPINNVDFDVYDCVAHNDTVDLKPLTEYYIGMELNKYDNYYRANESVSYDWMAKLRFNPNMLQFIHPASCPVNGRQWTSLPRRWRPSVLGGGKYDDGVGLEPAVELPVGVLAIVPDRFEGYRQPTGSDNTKAVPYFGLPMIKNLNRNAQVKVVNSTIYPASGYYGNSTYDEEKKTTISLFYTSHWYNETAFQNTLGPENSTFGPMDLVFNNTANNVHLLANSKIEDYYYASNFTGDSPKTKVRTSENNWFIRPTPIPEPVPLASKAGVYSGMQVRALQSMTITQVGRYFSSNPGLAELQKHKVIVMRSGGDAIAYGQFESYDSVTNFAYATLKPAPSSGNALEANYAQAGQPIPLKQGELYFIGVWDGKENGSVIGNKSFGWIEDYCRYKTGSALTIAGPAREAVSDGDNTPGLTQTVLLDSSGAGYPQGYGPLNMIYSPVPNTNEDYHEGYSLMRWGSSASAYYTTATVAGFFAHKITVGTSPVLVTHLGRMHTFDNSGRHQVCLIRAAMGAFDATNKPSEIVASVIVDANQRRDEWDSYDYERLEKPVVLQPGESYYLASLENTYERGTSTGVIDKFPSAGSCSLNTNNPLLGTGFSLDTTSNYMLGTDGWTSVAFAPLTNLKIN